MRTKVLKFKVLALLASVFVLALAIACGSSDETTTAAPTPDVAKIIQDAVNAQGATASGDIEQAVRLHWQDRRASLVRTLNPS